MSTFKNFVQCRVVAPITATDVSIGLYDAVSPYTLPSEEGGLLVLTDSPNNPSKIEVISYTSLTDLALYGVTRGLEGTTAQEWKGPVYCYQSLLAGEFKTLLDSKVVKVAGKGLSDTNFTQVEKTKLTGIATEATKNRADTLNADKVHTHTTAQVTGLDTALGTKASKTELTTGLGLKVDKVTGKGLSESDYTTAEKTKLGGIVAGATKNRVDTENADKLHTHTTAQVTGLDTALAEKAIKTTQVIAGTGLSGGGDLTANRTLSVKYGTAAGTAAQGNDSRLSNSREWTGATISQAEAEAGTATTRRAFTALSVRQAIVAWFNGISGTLGRTILTRTTAAQIQSDIGLGTAATKDVGTAAGQVMEVGAFGLGAAGSTPNPIDDDIDRVDRAIGFYSFKNSAAGALPPVDDKNGALIHTGYRTGGTGNPFALQLASSNLDKGLFFRQLRGASGWTPWMEIFTTDNLQQTTGTSTVYPMSQKVVTDQLATKANTSTQVIAGTGLTGGGTLASNRTLSVSYGTAASTAAQGNDSRINNGQTAFGWGSHAIEGYAKTKADVGLAGIPDTNASTANYLRGDGTWVTPPNTNTTYSEISTAEIDAGTASTARTISSRRIKYISDKKANTVHVHAISDVTGLQAAIDSKALTSTQVITGTGLSGGGTLAANRTLTVNYGTAAGTAAQGNDSRIVTAVPNSRTITAGTGLTGGGDFTANRSLAVTYGTAAGTAAQGNDSRITGAFQASQVVQVTGTSTTSVMSQKITTDQLATKAASSHTHPWAQVTGQPTTATRWPTWAEVTGKPTTFATATHTHNTIVVVDNRAIKPTGVSKSALNVYFTSKGGMTGTANSAYGDLLVLSGYSDASGGLQNALFFDKTTQEIIHYQGAVAATQWSGAKTLAYTTSNVASATKLATARTIGGVSFNGTANINLPGVNAAGTQSTTGNAGSATKLATARTINGVSFNGTANITVADATKLPLAGGTLSGSLSVTGDITATGNVTAYSDIKLKENIELIPDALAKISTLHGYTYNRKDIKDSARHTGVIAQEVQKVLPEAVMVDEDGTLSVAYGNMVGLLIEAIKELKAEVDRLKVNHKDDA